VLEVNFGGKATNEVLYANKRTEMWDLMAKWLQAGGAIPNHPELKTDLCTPTYSFNAANKMVLESKDDIRKRGLRSPDVSDALALTFAAPVMSKEQFQPAYWPSGSSRYVADDGQWNPFSPRGIGR